MRRGSCSSRRSGGSQSIFIQPIHVSFEWYANLPANSAMSRGGDIAKAFHASPERLLAALAFAMMFAAGCQMIRTNPPSGMETGAARAGFRGSKSAAARVQGMSLLSPTNDPAATRSVVYAGTGQLIPRCPVQVDTCAERREGVTLNSRQCVHRRVCKDDPRRHSRAQLFGQSQPGRQDHHSDVHAFSKSDLVDLFQNALRSSGATIIRNGAMYQVESADQFSRSFPESRSAAQAVPAGLSGPRPESSSSSTLPLGDAPHS